MRKLVLAFGLSALTAINTVALAADPLDGEGLEARKVAVAAPAEDEQAQPGFFQRVKKGAYNGLDRVGAVDLACGTGNCLKAGGRTLKDVGHVGVAAVDTVAALGNVIVAPFMLGYEGVDAAKQYLNTAKDYFLAAGSNLKTAATDMPQNYEDLKNGFGQLGSGASKAGVSIHDAVTSETVQNAASKAWNGIKSGASTVWNGLKNAGSKIGGWLNRTFLPNFENVDFS